MTLLLAFLAEILAYVAAWAAIIFAVALAFALFGLAHLGVMRASEWRERRAAGRFPE